MGVAGLRWSGVGVGSFRSGVGVGSFRSGVGVGSFRSEAEKCAYPPRSGSGARHAPRSGSGARSAPRPATEAATVAERVRSGSGARSAPPRNGERVPPPILERNPYTLSFSSSYLLFLLSMNMRLLLHPLYETWINVSYLIS